jgi:hypothetical protein
MKDPKKCIILVPAYSHVEPDTQRGLKMLEQRGYLVRRLFGNSQVDLARAVLAGEALSNGYEELFWIDSDIVFNPRDVERLRENGVPFCSGLYPKKQERHGLAQHGLACNLLPNTKAIDFGEIGGLLELSSNGFGFAYTEASIYHDIKFQLGLPEFYWDKTPIINYFIPEVIEESGIWKYLPDDLAFCHRARLCGFKIMADTRISLGHVGRKIYTWQDAKPNNK